MLIHIILVGIGGGIGAAIRAFFTDWVKSKWKKHFPLATFIINITGSFLLGIIIHYHADDSWRIFLGTGLMGGFTTFSTFHYETVSLIKIGMKRTFMFYYIFSVICSIAAAMAGIIL